jgi:hypothetical protein
LRATRSLRRALLFWRGAPRPPEADESLAALLARRDQVRAKQTAPSTQPSPDLFKPQKPVILVPVSKEAPLSAVASAEPEATTGAEQPAASTASRLLEAKRRAQQRKDQ